MTWLQANHDSISSSTHAHACMCTHTHTHTRVCMPHTGTHTDGLWYIYTHTSCHDVQREREGTRCIVHASVCLGLLPCSASWGSTPWETTLVWTALLSSKSIHDTSGCTLFKLFLIWGCSSVGRELDHHAADTGSIPRCGKGFFSQSQLSAQTLLSVSANCRVQSHTLTSVHTLKIL